MEGAEKVYIKKSVCHWEGNVFGCLHPAALKAFSEVLGRE